MKCLLPWDEVSAPELKKKVRTFIYSLAKEQETLSREIDELEFEFDFRLDMYAYQAVVLSKMDANLRDMHTRLVPVLIGDESFWRNYFYEIELLFKQLNLPSRLGDKLDEATRLIRE